MINTARMPWIANLGLVISLSLTAPARAEVGVSDKDILIGVCTPLTGPSSARGIQSREGAETYIDKINAAGGVNGRKVKVLFRDDGYEPQRTVTETKKLIAEDKVFALFQYYGTPGFKAVLPILTETNIPFIAAFTGAEVLRNPVLKNVFNVRQGYFDEMMALLSYAVEKKGASEIGIVFQDDAFGTEGKAGAYRAMTKVKFKITAEVPFKRNETNMGPAIEKLKAAGVKHVIAWMLAGQATDFIKQAAEQKLDATIYAMSGVAATSFFEAAKAYSAPIYISNGLPLLNEKSNHLVQQYIADAKASGHTPMEGAFEGYVNAMVLIEGLKRAGKDLTRAGLLKTFDNMSNYDLNGLKISYSPTDHRGIQSAFIGRVKGSEVVHAD